MDAICRQIKKRRMDINLLQGDFKKLIGMSQTQYQRIEAGGNPKLHTLQRLLKALKLNLVLVPQEKMDFLGPLLDSVNEDYQPQGPDSLLDKFRIDDE